MSYQDVRMRGFQNRMEVDEVTQLLQARVEPLGSEEIALTEAASRVLVNDVVSDVNVPAFARAAMDGYALKGEETFGAGPYNPLEFEVIGHSFPAHPCSAGVNNRQAVRIMTGAPIPEGANAVLMAEYAEEVSAKTDGKARVRVTDPVPPGKNVGAVGEDIAKASTVMAAGRILRPQDVGVLASIGASPVQVVRQPRVAVLVTGDELLPCGSKPEGFKIVDSNSVMLTALVQRDSGVSIAVRMLRDDYDIVKSAIREAAEDVILISGGSSVGAEDHAPAVIADLGELSVHGVALRPASPTGIGFLGSRPVFLMPGNPVSCLCAYDLFAGPTIRRLAGRHLEMPYRCCTLPLARKISSPVGRTDYVRVVVTDSGVEPLSTSGASILSSTTRADGFVVIPTNAEGYPPGTTVEVFFYD